MKVTLISCIVTKYFPPLRIAFVSDDWPISHDGLLNLSSSASIGEEEEEDEETKPKISTSASAEFFFVSRGTPIADFVSAPIAILSDASRLK